MPPVAGQSFTLRAQAYSTPLASATAGRIFCKSTWTAAPARLDLRRCLAAHAASPLVVCVTVIGGDALHQPHGALLIESLSATAPRSGVSGEQIRQIVGRGSRR